ncbi:MAG: helix-turn-helix domain-containing protein [Comamonadaceae bacterium]|nr:helix-turn-helix domain-containing protein [Comamonadaceae bacterium]
MSTAKSMSDPGADSEVVAHAQRRHFSPAQKRRILEEADRCTQPGEVGALMRREGIYSSSLSTWRRQREQADLAALAPQKRGPKTDPHRAESPAIAQLTRRARDSLKSRLDKARWSLMSRNWPPCWHSDRQHRAVDGAVQELTRCWAQAPPAGRCACRVAPRPAIAPGCIAWRWSDPCCPGHLAPGPRWRSMTRKTRPCWRCSTANASLTRPRRPCMPRCSTRGATWVRCAPCTGC